MTPQQLEAARAREKAIYDAEVAKAIEPKLHVLVVHLYVEHLLERLLTATLKSTKKLFGKNGLSFEKKLLLAEAVGSLKAQQVDGIRKLNAIRNDCAHQFQYQLETETLEAFGRTLGKVCTR